MTSSGTDRFAQWLNMSMENRGIRAVDLAKKLKVTDSAVSRWRSGAGLPSMDACLRMAKIFRVDQPMRLAVTAGLVDGKLIGVAELPLPEPTARRNRVKEQLENIKGLTANERQHLLNAYDERIDEAS
jgi:transcriptional regulator with XRE-family HTH domain